jgi:hypothetical protein
MTEVRSWKAADHTEQQLASGLSEGQIAELTDLPIFHARGMDGADQRGDNGWFGKAGFGWVCFVNAAVNVTVYVTSLSTLLFARAGGASISVTGSDKQAIRFLIKDALGCLNILPPPCWY